MQRLPQSVGQTRLKTHPLCDPPSHSHPTNVRFFYSHLVDYQLAMPGIQLSRIVRKHPVQNTVLKLQCKMHGVEAWINLWTLVWIQCDKGLWYLLKIIYPRLVQQKGSKAMCKVSRILHWRWSRQSNNQYDSLFYLETGRSLGYSKAHKFKCFIYRYKSLFGND